MSRNENSYSLKKKKYYRRPNYSVDFKSYEYKFTDSETISEEIAEECNIIEEEGGEVLTIVYNTIPIFNDIIKPSSNKYNTHINTELNEKKKKEEEEEEKEEVDSKNYKNSKKKMNKDKEDNISLLTYIKKRNYLNNNNTTNKSLKIKKNNNRNTPTNKDKDKDKNKNKNLFSYLKDSIINTASKAEMTIVYIIYCPNKLSIKEPRTFYFDIEEANSLNLNKTLGNIAVGQYNKLLLGDYKHICTLMDAYTPLNAFGKLAPNKIINIITFYAK